MTKWHIVPVNNGCTLMCKDSDGNFYIGRKEDTKGEDMVFDTETEAKQYIEDWFKPSDYKAEMFWILEGDK